MTNTGRHWVGADAVWLAALHALGASTWLLPVFLFWMPTLACAIRGT